MLMLLFFVPLERRSWWPRYLEMSLARAVLSHFKLGVRFWMVVLVDTTTSIYYNIYLTRSQLPTAPNDRGWDNLLLGTIISSSFMSWTSSGTSKHLLRSINSITWPYQYPPWVQQRLRDYLLARVFHSAAVTSHQQRLRHQLAQRTVRT